MASSRTRIPFAACMVAVVLATGACASSGSGEKASDTSDADLVVTGFDSLRFDAEAYQVEAGTFTVAYVNDSALRHTLLIKDFKGLKLDADRKGEIRTAKVTLEPGTYTLYCDVVGHENAGMVATLEVTAPAAG